MEVDKSRVSYQLTLLNFIQQDGMKELITDINDDIKHDSQCLLLLFMFLSNKLIHSWLPCLLKSHKDSLTPVSSYNKKIDHINIISDGEVNRLVGWALFAEIKKYRKLLKNTNDLKMFKRKETEETINVLLDMKAIECEILTNSEYIRRYYFTDDAIRNKGTLTLISPPYIQEFSKLSQRITNSYRSTESMKKSSGNIKTEVIKKLKRGENYMNITTLMNISKSRVTTVKLTDMNRYEIIMDILNRVSNAKIGNTIRNYRSQNLTRVNDVNFRTTLKVSSRKKTNIKTP